LAQEDRIASLDVANCRRGGGLACAALRDLRAPAVVRSSCSDAAANGACAGTVSDAASSPRPERAARAGLF